MDNKTKEKEQKRMDAVIGKIKVAQEKSRTEIKRAQKDSHAIRDDFSNNLRINTESYSGMFETATTIRQQQQLLQERENNWKHATRRLDILQKLEKKPYFARIDLQEKGEKRAESIYIGLGSFADRPDNFLVYDWRAPISSVYYDGGLGQVTYETPGGTQTVDVTLKRQFLVKDGKIKTVFDTDEAVGDQMLLDVLDDSSSSKMRSIVTTIQKEQNKIIRNTTADLLFVQGAAGSGKTSAVLQRVAYLLYRYRGKLTSSQVILFSPNQLFNDYVDQVLPELGEHNMVQMTYYQYTQRRLPKLKVETLQQRFERQVDETGRKIQKVKNSVAFFNAATVYAQFLEKKGMRFRDLKLDGKVFYEHSQLEKIYYSFNVNYHLRNRLDATKERLLRQLNRKIEKEAKSDWVETILQESSSKELAQLYGTHPRNFENNDAELRYLGRRFLIKHYQKIHSDLVHNRFLNINAQYLHFLHSVPELLDLKKYDLSNSEWEAGIEATIATLKKQRMLLEDVSPYLYLYDTITGKRGDNEIKHVFIDEIQDYTPFQLAALKHAFPRARFTVLGDLNQAIFTKKESYTLLDELRQLFAKQKIEVVQLTKSYRSTKQITDFTKQVLLNGAAVAAFERLGELPTITVKQNEAELAARMLEQLKENEREQLTTAIICKTLTECQTISEKLQAANQKAILIKSENQRLAPGTIIVPAFLAKGLEFDAVIMWNASQRNYAAEDERQLVYTICSRAMHRLSIFALKQLSPLFKRVAQDSYTLLE
ncbi:RNA polymerase recycling motor HelD [Liquorilactobacillus satsumensis]|uniref:ATP-dependent DNA helicase n=1 Tax=Liquorilactobacillus satsumensis DSM 16230 = JCM 12392 TaxID=1423801 RepID=A0A0R1UV17_9LACO|nr:RNA polymerase recycling motor HelD [Liquorilactobacillus satsumensis]KRL97009.1 ATP-dependent DNA helicase [Liquorilactobacillus satsumensis DSM 16230 = JCM 12392]MCC7666205.1 ATP-dependent DNA helicase [Liquorilactobacillus satsumensis]MCP9329110.1 AAA family ATPase [Liquorilactobacillus satsumensis]MCP9357774.1 AAA family ATPase [Liquorilactobacillus satsumensis]MCP9371460.1 AAA family ATPase [Liquorilactobacillus satsumensis]